MGRFGIRDGLKLHTSFILLFYFLCQIGGREGEYMIPRLSLSKFRCVIWNFYSSFYMLLDCFTVRFLIRSGVICYRMKNTPF
jgi:hypothetical protein